SVKSKLFVSYYLPDIKSPVLKDYDKAFRLWQLSATKQYTDDQVVELLGAYLGQKFVNDLDMEWVEITDEYGTDYAVRGKVKEITSFPFSTVFKRVEDNEYDFLYGVYHTVKAMLGESDY